MLYGLNDGFVLLDNNKIDVWVCVNVRAVLTPPTNGFRRNSVSRIPKYRLK